MILLPARRVADIVKGRLAEKEGLRTSRRHDCDVLLIRGNEHADAPSIRSRRARLSPTSAPQSWITSVIFRRSSWTTNSSMYRI